MTSNILFMNDEESRCKINIDELYDKNLQRDLKQLSIFNKILNRIHKRIQLTARNKRNEHHAWFVVPTYLFGEPNYDQHDCIAYLVAQLVDNGFHVRYIHPNTIFISWENWVPSYVRTEIKKKTGQIINEKGQIVGTNQTNNDVQHDPDMAIMNDRSQPPLDNKANQEKNKQYTPIDQYKPSGNLVYNPEMFYRIDMKTKGTS